MEMSCEMVLKTLLLLKCMTYAPSSLFYKTVVGFKDGNWMVLTSLLYDKSSLTDCMFFYCQSNPQQRDRCTVYCIQVFALHAELAAV